MKSIVTLAAWAAFAGVILYAAVNPHTGLVYQSPGAAIGVMLIGMGLCKHAQDRARTTAAQRG